MRKVDLNAAGGIIWILPNSFCISLNEKLSFFSVRWYNGT